MVIASHSTEHHAHHHHHHDGHAHKHKHGHKHAHDHAHEHGHSGAHAHSCKQLGNLWLCCTLVLACCVTCCDCSSTPITVKSTGATSEITLPAGVQNYTIQSFGSSISLTVSLCEGAIDWNLFSPQGVKLSSFSSEAAAETGDSHDDHAHTATATPDIGSSVKQYVSTAASSGNYTLMVTAEKNSTFTVYSTTDAQKRVIAPLPSEDELEVHTATATTLEIEWKATTSIAQDDRRYTLYLAEVEHEEEEEDHHEEEEHDEHGTIRRSACGLEHVAEHHSWTAVVNLTGNPTSYTFSGLEANHEYHVDLLVTDTRTGIEAVYRGVTARTAIASASSSDSHSSKTTAWAYSMLAVAGVSVLSLTGSLLLFSRQVLHWMPTFMGLSAGTLLGSAFLTLLPEANDVYNFDVSIGAIAMAGAVSAFFVDTFIHVHHKHGPITEQDAKGLPLPSTSSQKQLNGVELVVEVERTTESDESDPETEEEDLKMEAKESLGWLILLGDMFHSFVDGALIGASFLESTSTGLSVTLAVFAHEFPQEIGDFCLLLQGGWSVKSALLANFTVSLASVLGAAIALLVGTDHEDKTNYLLPFAGGFFIYLALGGVVPELIKLPRAHFIWSIVALCAGIGIMALLLLIDDGHNHSGEAAGAHAGHNH